MKIALGNFLTLTKREGNAELLRSLLDVVNAAHPSDEKFRELVGSQVKDDAHVVLASAEGCVRISTGTSRAQHEPLWLDIGCVSKLVTATTIQTLLKGQAGALRQNVADVLDLGAASHHSALTLEHLLNHTHGIDEPQGIAVPTLNDGKIDLPKVLSLMGPNALHPAGQMYSYACVGPWLIAAFLEKKFGGRFIDIVRDVLPTIMPDGRADDQLCPALGGTVRVDAERLLEEFVRATTFATPLATRQVKLGPALSVPYPGWHPQEHAISAGWKAYRNGWFGHQAILTSTPMMVRVSPSDGIGFIVSSRSVHPWRILGSLFSEEFIGRPTPAKMTPHRLDNTDRIGMYQRVDSHVAVSANAGILRMDATSNPGPHSTFSPVKWSSQMKPIGNELFGIASSLGGEANHAFIQFIRDDSGRVTHLWNGGMLWRKTA